MAAVVVVAALAVAAPRTVTGWSKVTVTAAPGPKPNPLGVNTSVSGSGVDQTPGALGVRVGRAVPNSLATGSSKVRMMGALVAAVALPGAGSARATGPPPAGTVNHVTVLGVAATDSQGRGAAATRRDPATVWGGTVR